MVKKILITGATDGIGLETARILAKQGHHLILHGRNAEKLKSVTSELSALTSVDSEIADLSDMEDVSLFAGRLLKKHTSLDVLINNAGVLKTPETTTKEGIDIRFVVNTLSPYILIKKLLPLFQPQGRVINLSSAAQAPVDLEALSGNRKNLDDMTAYSQSKLAITMWSKHLAQSLKEAGPLVIAVNPGSLLASKMVKEGFGIAGKDLSIGATILTRLALDDEFADASGKYFDNDAGQLSDPHEDALDDQKCDAVVKEIEAMTSRYLQEK